MIRPFIELYLAHKHSRESWDPSQALAGKERRVFERVKVTVPCRMDHQLFGLESQGATVNLSLGGMGVVAPVSWPEGSQVRVSFDSLSLEGLVVYRKTEAEGKPDCRYGIKFQKLRFSDLFKLRKILHQKYPGPLAGR